MLGSSPVRDGGFQRGRIRLREQSFQRPFGLLLLILFLQEQEKYVYLNKSQAVMNSLASFLD